MSKVFLSLNFMHCMERFATQIYLTHKGAFKDDKTVRQLIDASVNERGHVEKLRAQIKTLHGHVYPFGFLFQLMGIVLGLITRMCGKRNIFKADIFVETRAVTDYNSFIRNVKFDESTVELIRTIIKDEEEHILRWYTARKSLPG